MEAYCLETIVGETVVPAGRHVYVSLNPRVATLARIEDITDANVFFFKDKGSSVLSNFPAFLASPQLNEYQKILYHRGLNGALIPLPRAVITSLLVEEAYWDASVEQKAFCGEALSRRELRKAKGYLNQHGMRLADPKIESLLSMEPGMPDEWPFEKLARLSEGYFDARTKRAASLYSKAKRAVEAALKNGNYGARIEIEELKLTIPPQPAVFSDYLVVQATFAGKTSNAADIKVLAFEDNGLPKSIQSIYADLWQLAQDYNIIKRSVEMLLFNYLVNGQGINSSKARKAAESVALNIIGKNPNSRPPSHDSIDETLLLIRNLNNGHADAFYSHRSGFFSQLVVAANQLAAAIPEEFMQVYEQKLAITADNFEHIALTTYSRIDRPARREKERIIETRRQSASKVEARVVEKYATGSKKPKNFFDQVLRTVTARNPGTAGDKIVTLMNSSPDQYITAADFASTASRYRLPMLELVAESLFR